jgi:hypothetical protein
MHITYYFKEKISEINTPISEISNFSLPRIFPINKDIKLLSCNDDNKEFYMSIYGFGFKSKSVWVSFPGFKRKDQSEYFLIGINLNYLNFGLKNTENLNQKSLIEIFDKALNSNPNLHTLIKEEFNAFTGQIQSFGLSSKNVQNFVLKIAYYLNLYFVNETKNQNQASGLEVVLN